MILLEQIKCQCQKAKGKKMSTLWRLLQSFVEKSQLVCRQGNTSILKHAYLDFKKCLVGQKLLLNTLHTYFSDFNCRTYWSVNSNTIRCRNSELVDLRRTELGFLSYLFCFFNWVIHGWWHRFGSVVYGCLFWFLLNQHSAAQQSEPVLLPVWMSSSINNPA